MDKARAEIEGMTAEAEVGKIYRGKVVTIKEFGAFVEFLPGKDGLVHVSELANFRVKSPEDIVKMGDEIWVKCLGVDEKGRVRLSRKAAMADRDKEMRGDQEGGEGAPAAEGGEGHSPEGDYRQGERAEGERREGDRPEGDRRPGERREDDRRGRGGPHHHRRDHRGGGGGGGGGGRRP
jgi:polyribonucleotide nucleotidyltransferase